MFGVLQVQLQYVHTNSKKTVFSYTKLKELQNLFFIRVRNLPQFWSNNSTYTEQNVALYPCSKSSIASYQQLLLFAY